MACGVYLGLGFVTGHTAGDILVTVPVTCNTAPVNAPLPTGKGTYRGVCQGTVVPHTVVVACGTIGIHRGTILQ
jgi:hypothetical protein